MSDCSSEFLEFNKRISLNKTDKKYLRSARNSIVKKIHKYFQEHSQCPKVEFKGQGSFSMGTIIKPVNGDYDIDVGIYLKGFSNWRNEWAKPETVSQWLIKALYNHTSIKPINKETCIRIRYKPTSPNSNISYHVDLPIYIEYRNFWDAKKTRIGLNGDNQWSKKSDPVGFTRWFFEKCKKNKADNKQLVRLVKYMKAWKDFVSIDKKFPSGMALTILLSENFRPSCRDDIAFKETIRHSYNSLYGFLKSDRIYSPVEPYNDVTSKLTPKQKQYFKECFEKLVDNAKLAIDESDSQKALHRWRMHFDKRM
jgi:hypothetical protein